MCGSFDATIHLKHIEQIFGKVCSIVVPVRLLSLIPICTGKVPAVGAGAGRQKSFQVIRRAPAEVGSHQLDAPDIVLQTAILHYLCYFGNTVFPRCF